MVGWTIGIGGTAPRCGTGCSTIDNVAYGAPSLVPRLTLESENEIALPSEPSLVLRLEQNLGGRAGEFACPYRNHGRPSVSLLPGLPRPFECR